MTGVWPFRTTRRTILASASASESRIQHYSNPDVECKNKATGTSTRNNARKIREERCVVAGFRSYALPLSVYISGDTDIEPEEYGYSYYTAIPSYGTPPYTYRWCDSPTGHSYNYQCDPITSSNTKMHYFYPDGTTYNRWIRLTVYDATGSSATAFMHVSVDQVNSYYRIASEQELEDQETNVAVYPNPTEGPFQLKISLPEEHESFTYTIYDLGGKVVVPATQGILTSTGSSAISGIDLREGVYLVRVKSGDYTENIKLVIKH